MTANQGIEFAVGRLVDEVHRVGIQQIGLLLRIFRIVGFGDFGFDRRRLQGNFVGNHPQDIQPGNPLFIQKIDGVGILFHKDGSQNVADRHLFFFSRTHVVDGPLNNPLKTDGLLKDIFIALGNHFHVFIEKRFQAGLQVIDIATTFFKNFQAGIVMQDGKQHVFDAHVLVTALLCFTNRKSQRGTEFLADHILFLFHAAA